MKNYVLPKATYIVSSGTGLHIYYFLKEPIPLYPKNQAYLKELKYALTRQIWNRYTSTLKEPQIQGIMQGYRIVGTQSKLGKAYPVRAYMYGRGERVDIETLFEAVPSTSGEREIILKAKSDSGLTLEQAKENFPQWYEERILQKLPRKRWHIKRDLYDWWLNRIRSEIKVGHRYYGIMTLAVYAIKCDISLEKLQTDAFSLLPAYDEMSDNDLNRFTREDVMAALELYNESYCTFPRDDISKLSGLHIEKNKRNGRKQSEHIRLMNFVRDEINGNKDWRNKYGRPKGSGTSAQKVYEWRQLHEDGKKIECERETGLSRHTVLKWWEYVPKPEHISVNIPRFDDEYIDQLREDYSKFLLHSELINEDNEKEEVKI